MPQRHLHHARMSAVLPQNNTLKCCPSGSLEEAGVRGSAPAYISSATKAGAERNGPVVTALYLAVVTENKIPQARKNSLPYYQKTSVFLGKSTC